MGLGITEIIDLIVHFAFPYDWVHISGIWILKVVTCSFFPLFIYWSFVHIHHLSGFVFFSASVRRTQSFLEKHSAADLHCYSSSSLVS